MAGLETPSGKGGHESLSLFIDKYLGLILSDNCRDVQIKDLSFLKTAISVTALGQRIDIQRDLFNDVLIVHRFQVDTLAALLPAWLFIALWPGLFLQVLSSRRRGAAVLGIDLEFFSEQVTTRTIKLRLSKRSYRRLADVKEAALCSGPPLM